LSEDKLKETNNEEENVDDYQAKEKNTLTTSDISANKDREKNRKDNRDIDIDSKKE